jgi:NADPH-dependent 2,4-dienoyl-CoA reductase/sulfur reductase-like enzyme
MNVSNRPGRPHVVVVGAGMAGLATVRALSRAPVTVQLIDAHNYTAFPPLLFQVATCFISPARGRPAHPGAAAPRSGRHLPDGTGGRCGLARPAGSARP